MFNNKVFILGVEFILEPLVLSQIILMVMY